MGQTTPKPRRASGTRTMPDVLRHLFRPPTAAQKKADVEDLHSGGELIVAARLTSARPQSGVHWVPQGYLHLTNEKITWKSGHKLPDLTFSKDEWIVRSTAPGRGVPRMVIVRQTGGGPLVGQNT